MAYRFPVLPKPCITETVRADAREGGMFQNIKQASLRSLLRAALIFPALCYPVATWAADEPDVPSPSNYGGAGLLDTRTARFYPEGYLALTTSATEPDDRYAITFQALPWAEFTFRYAINNALFDTGQALHDRSFDLKFRLSHETQYAPEIALGLQDILGTGVYSGEYFVGSKHWGAFDFTLGLGWGRLGSRGTFENPFGLIKKSLLVRNTNFGNGGVPLLATWFRGPDVGLFGGFEYQTPIQDLKLKVEYSSDAYVQEKRESGNDYSFPVNVGLDYRPYQWLDVGLSLMHRNFMGLRISVLMDTAEETWKARLNPPPRFRARPEGTAPTILEPAAELSPLSAASRPETRFVDLTAERAAAAGPAGTTSQVPASQDARMSATAALPATAPAAVTPVTVPAAPITDADVVNALVPELDSQGLSLLGAGIEGDKIVVAIENPRYRRDSEAIARTARILSAQAPPFVNTFEITLTRTGQPIATVTLPRSEIDNLARHESSPEELLQKSELQPGQAAPLDHLQMNLFPNFGAYAYPVFRQMLFDPDHPVYVEFGAGATGGLRLSRGWFVEGTFVASLYDDYYKIHRDANSVLPHVRSDIAQYLKKGKYGIENFSTSYYFKLAPELYGRVTGGYLERMFAGFGGELLYRPFGQRWAIGADLWAVQQRGYDVLLDLRTHEAITGHLTAYYDLPWHDVRVAVSAGQYLAGDKGLTFQFERRFSTGVVIGAWATFTNVSAQQFGEGSFDKGIRIVIPLEWAAPFATQSGYDLKLRPIQRDGGQQLDGDMVLYGLTDPADYGALTKEWSSVFK